MNPNSAETHRITGLSLKGRKTPEEIKKRIGDSVRRYLTEHPDRVPYLLNHSSKGPSYPERYFKKLFEEENIQLEFMVPVLSYVLDFCDSVRKIDVEIDGEQHYVDKRIVKHDINRNRRLIEDGWRIYRIRWSEYKRLDYDEKHNEIEKLKNFLGA
jgi:very-short-patch-repair endonuclease